MNDLRKAAEQALEALEKMSPDTDTLVEVEPHIWEYRSSLVIQALRQALAQPDEVLAEREAVIETIDELMGMESDRHPMFSEGYDYALDHIKQFVRGRDRRDKEEKNT
jgi:hypothetical protein